jgi:hypothetical protein
MGTKPVYKILWFEQSGVTDKVQKSTKERMRIQVFWVVMLCHWLSFPKFLKTLKVEISTFLQILRTTNSATCAGTHTHAHIDMLPRLLINIL